MTKAPIKNKSVRLDPEVHRAMKIYLASLAEYVTIEEFIERQIWAAISGKKTDGNMQRTVYNG